MRHVSAAGTIESVRRIFFLGLLIAACPALAAPPPVLEVYGVDGTGATTLLPAAAYRWLVEEDRTYHVEPGTPDSHTLAVRFHASYMPVVAKGPGTSPLPERSPTVATTYLDPDKHYYLSVTPTVAGTWSIGGAQLAPGQDTVRVYVNQLPLPTAQIRVFAHQDNQPINGALDAVEEGLGGFQILVADAGGRYGQSGGQQLADAFGNPLGTEYQYCTAAGVPSAYCTAANVGQAVLDGDGAPVPTGVVTPLVTGACPGPACGELMIRNLTPGKYGIQVVPPAGSGWQQTSTIEGSKTIDAWVKANEPPFFAEFGPPGYHASFGFVKEFTDPVLSGGQTIEGSVTNLHLSRPPEATFYSSAPVAHTIPWVGLNDNAGTPGASRAIYAARANTDGSFEIPNVPPGLYQLVVWDEYLDFIIAFHQVEVTEDGCTSENGTCDFGDVPVFQWFTRQQHTVFYDADEDGIRDPGEAGIPDQNINIRFRDGTIDQSYPTDGAGYLPFDVIFPYFSWQVAEVDFARMKATGVTVSVDDGGAVDANDPYSAGGQLNPQAQSESSGGPSRTELGPVLLEAFQGFIGQTSVFDWGKKPYAAGENGGISGIVYYATTRAENDPAYAAAENWEPGVPGVTVQLWKYDSAAPDKKGAAVAQVATDSWDASVPENCQGDASVFPFVFDPDGLGPEPSFSTDCYDGMRNWNQVRPGVFDGGYAFTLDYSACATPFDPDPDCADAAPPLPAGRYVVEVVLPPGYEIVKEEDKNVDFGDTYVPAPQLLPPPCVGPGHEVPLVLSLFPDSGIAPVRAGDTTPLCTAKLVTLNDRQNAAADFFLFTETPVAGHIFGFVLDDTANEFDPNSPQFGEKYAPPWLPISIRDWTGREIGRTYSDQYGRYNALVPSTYTKNVPAPSGVSPNMITACINDGLLPDGSPDPYHNQTYTTFCYTFMYMPGTTTYLDTPAIPGAAFAASTEAPLDCESQTGTPRIKQATVLPPPGAPPAGTSASDYGPGPYISRAAADVQTPIASQGRIVLTSQGAVQVTNPLYGGVGSSEPALISRDYGFGSAQGSVTLTTPAGSQTLPVVSWNDAQIVARLPRNLVTRPGGGSLLGPYAGQITVTRSNGRSSNPGISLQVGLRRCPSTSTTACAFSPTVVTPGQSIQAAIDAAPRNDLILIQPGTYNEMLVMWKPVQLQGAGAGSTFLRPLNVPAERLHQWRQKVRSLYEAGSIDLLPAQEVDFTGIEPATLFNEEGAGVFVLGRSAPPGQTFGNQSSTNGVVNNRGARIDGLTISGAMSGGGVVVNGYASYLQISNNRILHNSGSFSGGVRVGHPQLIDPTPAVPTYQDGFNDFVVIRNNYISQNAGTTGGAGGGVSVCNGSDNYQVANNEICGNFSMGNGAGVGHMGFSGGRGLIQDNRILFNENFNQGIGVSGGGILIAGEPPLAGQTLSPGSGSVLINRNLIKQNAAGAGDGGGIALLNVNGLDAAASTNTNNWHVVDVTNNMIVQNVAALAGGGISLQETARARIVHNTIARNDSTATAGPAFSPGFPNESNPQPAGVVSRAHSDALATVVGAAATPLAIAPRLRVAYANPFLDNNIIWQNRSFYFTNTPPLFPLVPAATPYQDLAVLSGLGDCLAPRFSFLTTLAPDCDYSGSGNKAGNPRFVRAAANESRTGIISEVTTGITAPPAFDEGGNFIRVRFGPLTEIDPTTGVPFGDYHLASGSPAPAVNAGSLAINISHSQAPTLVPALIGTTVDFDRELRLLTPDMGADER